MVAVLTRSRSGNRDESIDVALRALADSTRRGILLMVRDTECSAGQVAKAFPHITRPAVSQHLGILEGADLVAVRRDGNRRLYSARPDGLAEPQAFIDQMWPDALRRLKIAAEQAQADKDARADRSAGRGRKQR